MDGGGPYWGSHLFHNRNQIIPVFQIILSLFTFCAEKNVKFAELIWFVQSLSSAYSSSAANFIEFKFSNSKYLFQNQIELLTIVFTWRMCSRTNEKNIVTSFFHHSQCCWFLISTEVICQKCPFSSAKKWHFECPDLRTESKNLAKHSPKWLCRHLGHAFRFLGGF